ncbi:MAG: Gfo/Idh/MocA family oxidoreductase [Acidimicrobiales bacterium]
MRIAVLGLGAVGARAARQLAASEGIEQVILRDTRSAQVDEVAASLGPVATVERAGAPAVPEADAVILAGPPGNHAALALELIAADAPVVSVSDAIVDVEGLLDLGPLAEARETPLVIGAGFAPGLSCVLARHAAVHFDRVDEIHVAKSGTGGPACARQHHRALGGAAIDWRDGGWQRRPGGSGRELCWFPDPVGGQDCYRAPCPTPCSSSTPSRAWNGSRPGWPPIGAIGSPPACPCSGRLIRRATWAPSGSRSEVGGLSAAPSGCSG